MSLPSWERGLKYYHETDEIDWALSLPSWERGLKFVADFGGRCAGESLPSWERGLKYSCYDTINVIKVVAPFMGAWIEILKGDTGPQGIPGRSLHGSVD